MIGLMSADGTLLGRIASQKVLRGSFIRNATNTQGVPDVVD
jgi:hypothetical protein